MLLTSGQIYSGFKKAIIIFIALFFCSIKLVSAQNPIKDPNNPDLPILPNPIQMPPAQLYNVLKDNNPDAIKKTGDEMNKSLKDKIEKDSLVKETTPQSMNPTEQTYG